MNAENNIKKWLISKEFLKCSALTGVSVSEFLCRTIRDVQDVVRINNRFDDFLIRHMEEALEENSIPIGVWLYLVEIDDVVKYMKAKFLTVVKVDNKLLSENALDLFIDIICEPSRFFNIFRGRD